MFLEKKAEGKNGRKERPREQMAVGKKADGKNNNMKSNFSTAANIFVKNFFYAYWI